MRRLLCCLGLGALALCLSGAVAPKSAQWKERSSTHFDVYHQGDAPYAAQVGLTAEKLYQRINAELGFDHVVKDNHLSFWLWDQRCKIYLYPDRERYRQETGAPPWSSGRVNYKTKVVSSYPQAEGFLDSVLPHEMAHILFREFVGTDNPEVPRWLDEGVAQYAEEDQREGALRLMRQGVAEGRYVPFLPFQHMDVSRADGNTARVYYAQAVSIVHFWLKHYGSRSFIDLCSNLRDGYALERAMSFATGGSVSTLGDLEEVWRRFLLAGTGDGEAAAPVGSREASAWNDLGGRAPDFRLKEVGSGGEVSLSDRIGRGPIALLFWSPGGDPRGDVLEHVQGIWARGRDRGLQVLAVASLKGDDSAQGLSQGPAEGRGISYPVLIDEGARVTADLYHVPPVPVVVLLDCQGILRYAETADPKSLQGALEQASGRLLEEGGCNR